MLCAHHSWVFPVPKGHVPAERGACWHLLSPFSPLLILLLFFFSPPLAFFSCPWIELSKHLCSCWLGGQRGRLFPQLPWLGEECMSSTPLCPPVFVSGKSYPIPFPLGSLAGSCSCGWVIPVSPSQSNPGKNNSMSVNVEMDRESRRAARTDARGSSLLPQEPGASLGPALRPRSPMHGAGLQRTLWFFIISLSVIGFLLNLFAWFVLQCVSGNILHLCILITVKFEDKNLCCTVSCFQWGKTGRGSTVERRC